ncbi:MAG: hypothetical protein RJA07_925 [Bacteroidota bacterium]|jgi:hypothetical protein
MKKWWLFLWLGILLTGISYLFWQQEWKYSLPTPIPKNYHAVKHGDVVTFPNSFRVKNNKPLLIHFFNPNCPCSKFNIPHFKSLVKAYSSKMNFAIVVLNSSNEYSVEDIQSKFDLVIPVSFDTSIAVICGVYSTPQAAIFDRDNKLYYRGNYNKSRYCTDKQSNFAQMAIDSLLNHHDNPNFSIAAIKSYGCELPKCCKK